MIPPFVNNLFEVNAANFSTAAHNAFHFQYESNAVYQSFCKALKVDVEKVPSDQQIPFLPIGFFKTHNIVSTTFQPEAVFESSGTSQTVQSKHAVKSLAVYEDSFFNAFQLQYGSPENWCFIGLLPSYLERSHSSLVYMVKRLMDESQHLNNGFYLNEFDKLYDTLKLLETNGQQTMLIGVTFGLLDFAEKYQLHCYNTTIMETGGMKGRREELTREEVHQALKKSFGVKTIHSEYGMTELLSQAYSTGDGLFHCPPWMKVLVRDEDDPLQMHTSGKGALNIIDLANLYSCCFIATDDVGEVYEDGSFRVLGRMDNSDIRGCSLLAL
ncbi:MAG: acyl transferase [Lacibacter sp.]